MEAQRPAVVIFMIREEAVVTTWITKPTLLPFVPTMASLLISIFLRSI